MKVYLDDERPTPAGWTRTYSVKETCDLLLTQQVTDLSLDNDLGSSDPSTEGHNVLSWLEEQVFNDPNFKVPRIYIHSQNVSRVPMMKMVARKLDEVRRKQFLNELIRLGALLPKESDQ